ncbi:hypothetical protein NMY22_g9033 [Coprinellus aureogranulatus]|nr:hypothetical protein NMY22_g9033 [Coprinellus aureogranulatus]
MADPIPNELLSLIIREGVFTPDDFRETLATDPLHHPHLTSGPKHGTLTTKVALVDRRFHQVAMVEMWRYVAVRSAAAAKAIAALAPVYGRFTERLDLRIRGSYPPHLVAEIIKHMPGLKILLLFSHTDEETFHHTGPPIFAVTALSHEFPALKRPEIKRMDFEGPRELPSVIILRELLNANPQLISLRVVDIVPPDSYIDWTVNRPFKGEIALQQLSLGSDYATLTSERTTRGLNAFVDMLCAHGAMDNLDTVHIKQFTADMYSFLQLYGGQLRHLTMVAPDHHSDPLHDREILNLCPHLDSLVWYINNCVFIDPWESMPSGHENVQIVTIIASNPGPYIGTSYGRNIRNILEIVRDGDFPKLQVVRLKLRGTGSVRDVGEDWIENMKTEFKEDADVSEEVVRGLMMNGRGVFVEPRPGAGRLLLANGSPRYSTFAFLAIDHGLSAAHTRIGLTAGSQSVIPSAHFTAVKESIHRESQLVLWDNGSRRRTIVIRPWSRIYSYLEPAQFGDDGMLLPKPHASSGQLLGLLLWNYARLDPSPLPHRWGLILVLLHLGHDGTHTQNYSTRWNGYFKDFHHLRTGSCSTAPLAVPQTIEFSR